ncbi:transposase [Lysobacter sp. ISL-42]|nr:transposase [Lysobacter sp. ISL-42]MBT2751633.1 transposase [Lysobacter sp. ISL-50]MBT2775827.1 transposase [Lysobacter sp. ISL-54]MBT2782208.1 transposase [Lysobacter sp. ISL-52]
MKYRFINDHRHTFRTATICRLLRVARGGFYQWLRKPRSDRTIEDDRLLGLIRDSYTASSGVYGSRRVCGDLREAGEGCSKHRVAKIMRT